jgi:hypothetical protein
MSEREANENPRCAHPECGDDLSDKHIFRSVQNGEAYCSKEHLLAHSNGKSVDD